MTAPNITALLYLVAGILFIQALRGLSNPETSRRGNYLGMAGMAIAIVTTLFLASARLGQLRPDLPRRRHRRRRSARSSPGASR